MKRIMQTRTLILAAALCGGQLLVTNQSLAQTWSGCGAPTDVEWLAVASSADGTKLAAAANYPNWAIYISANSGASWTRGSNIAANCIASSADGTKLAAGNNNAIFTSSDSGASWTQTSAPKGSWLGITSSSDGTKLAAWGQQTQPPGLGIYSSMDSGNTWTLTSAPATNWNGLAASADGTMLVASVGGNGYFYTSTDSGTNWTARTNVPPIWWGALASSADGAKLTAVTVGDGIYTSSDGGTNWTKTTAPNEDWIAIASSADGTRIAAAVRSGFGAGAPGPLYTSMDSGATWTSSNLPDEYWNSIAALADGKFVACSVSIVSTSAGGFMVSDQIVTSTPHPWLRMEASHTNVTVIWPWPMDGYILQQKLGLDASWVSMQNAPIVTNYQNEVTLPLLDKGFYQLVK